jgi:hypothetical protein
VTLARQSEPAVERVAVERQLAQIFLLAASLAELVAPPAIGHHPETPPAMVTDLRLPHQTLAQELDRLSISVIGSGHSS